MEPLIEAHAGGCSLPKGAIDWCFTSNFVCASCTPARLHRNLSAAGAAAAGDDDEIYSHTHPSQPQPADALFRLVHARSFGVATQALLLLFQLMSSRSTVSDRFYRWVIQSSLSWAHFMPKFVAVRACCCFSWWATRQRYRQSHIPFLLCLPHPSVLQGALRRAGQPGAVSLHQVTHVPVPAVQGALCCAVLCVLHMLCCKHWPLQCLCPASLAPLPNNSQYFQCVHAAHSFSAHLKCVPLASIGTLCPLHRLASAVGAPACHGAPTRKTQARAEPSRRSARAAARQPPPDRVKTRRHIFLQLLPPPRLVTKLPKLAQLPRLQRAPLHATTHCTRSFLAVCPHPTSSLCCPAPCSTAGLPALPCSGHQGRRVGQAHRGLCQAHAAGGWAVGGWLGSMGGCRGCTSAACPVG